MGVFSYMQCLKHPRHDLVQVRVYLRSQKTHTAVPIWPSRGVTIRPSSSIPVTHIDINMIIDHTLDLKREGVAISLGQQPNYDTSANAHSFLVPTKGYITAPCGFLPRINKKLICNSATMLKHWTITYFAPFSQIRLTVHNYVTPIRILRKRTTKLAERKSM